jgi:hypothetical protein
MHRQDPPSAGLERPRIFRSILALTLPGAKRGPPLLAPRH